MLLTERFQIVRPLEEMESALVRAICEQPELINPTEEAIVRTALSLARLYKVRSDGRDVGVGAFLTPFRDEILRRLTPVLLSKKGVRREELLALVRDLRERTLSTRDALVTRFRHRLAPEAIDRELRSKSLVLVLGGGGGTAYVYVGVMAMLDEFGIKPSLIVGTSMGAILGLFRSRLAHFDQAEIINIVRGLSWRRLFRLISTENRYGVPAALRLFLRAGIGRHFNPSADPIEDQGLRLADLPIPTIVTVSGIKRGKMPHPLEFYERLLSVSPRTLIEPFAVARKIQGSVGALAELFGNPEVMTKIHLGADAATREFDALDAVGFSSAVPGVIHYDLLRDDARMRRMLDGLFEERGLFRLVDGGLTDNLACRAAWRAVHRGQIGTRNVFILGLNAFAVRLNTPLWLPLQRLAEITVKPNRPWAHLIVDFKRTLSPLELVPSVEEMAKAMQLGRKQITLHVPYLTRMLAPLPLL